MSINQSKTVAYTPKRAALNWVDYLVIAATGLTFLAVLAANNPHTARAQTRTAMLTAADLPEQVSQLASDPGMIKARIGLNMVSR